MSGKKPTNRPLNTPSLRSTPSSPFGNDIKAEEYCVVDGDIIDVMSSSDDEVIWMASDKEQKAASPKRPVTFATTKTEVQHYLNPNEPFVRNEEAMVAAAARTRPRPIQTSRLNITGRRPEASPSSSPCCESFLDVLCGSEKRNRSNSVP